jgi:DnaJ family protein C protein 28
LRTGQIQTADEKLKASLPQVSTKPISQQAGGDNWAALESTITHGGTFVEPEPTASPKWEKQQPSDEPVAPYLVTFKVPSHAQASIKLGNFVSTPPRAVTSSPFATLPSGDPLSARSRADRKAEKRFAEGAGRLDRARESTLDYRIGVHGQEGGSRMRPNPVSMRGWNNLIEERIQVSLGRFT